MAEQFYTLQYHLYTVALHRYLKLRLPGYEYERHFGGVRYLFLRGLDPARPEMGTFSARPAGAWVAELSERWGGGANSADLASASRLAPSEGERGPTWVTGQEIP